MPSATTGQCENKECAVGYATVSENEEQTVFIYQGVTVEFEDDKSKAKGASEAIISHCTSVASAAIKSGSDEEVSVSKALDTMTGLTACIENSMTERIRKANEEIRFQAKIRRDMGAKWENYTCADLNVTSSEPVENITWSYNFETRDVHKMLDRDASKIYVVDDFISPEECQAMEKAANPSLHRATTADGDGGSKVSDARKAMQAGVKVPWHKEASGDPIATLSRRVYDFTNFVTGFDLEEHGQEDLMSIQYFGDNYEKGEPPDRYMPHCDGDCNGLPHRIGNRVATMVVYCEIPEVGGATQFRNSGIHLKPKVGMATFFSYVGSDGIMDDGFTEHSGCPVLKGNKKIVTQWMRKGVDKDNPWDSFNTLGVQETEEH
eukprot:CAMPEP_0116011330 /NCGR_PEP_ID=MMETSP0321-20121206/4510_1 /TAXON_ID=163516 /ORGANISM="Leptocylindrus danicus var. danicus, Strain B650" /LENGTH=377 /DNA_ID=CAMNT_0003480555 /DNA_START=124 /DNA_END=1257 /DNA_ORIENTATION=+